MCVTDSPFLKASYEFETVDFLVSLQFLTVCFSRAFRVLASNPACVEYFHE